MTTTMMMTAQAVISNTEIKMTDCDIYLWSWTVWFTGLPTNVYTIKVKASDNYINRLYEHEQHFYCSRLSGSVSIFSYTHV